jgi:hypothetical protein
VTWGSREPLARGPDAPVRPAASVIAVTDQSIATAGAAATPACSRFHAIRQRGEQNRACSRLGVNAVPHCAHSRTSATARCYAPAGTPPGGRQGELSPSRRS